MENIDITELVNIEKVREMYPGKDRIVVNEIIYDILVYIILNENYIKSELRKYFNYDFKFELNYSTNGIFFHDNKLLNEIIDFKLIDRRRKLNSLNSIL